MGNSAHEHIQLLSWNKDVTLKNVDEFRLSLLSLIENDKKKMILELSQVAYLNSAALGVIADAVISSGRSGKELVIAGIQSTVSEIFKIVHFHTFMKIFTEVQDAYLYLQGENG